MCVNAPSDPHGRPVSLLCLCSLLLWSMSRTTELTFLHLLFPSGNFISISLSLLTKQAASATDLTTLLLLIYRFVSLSTLCHLNTPVLLFLLSKHFHCVSKSRVDLRFVKLAHFRVENWSQGCKVYWDQMFDFHLNSVLEISENFHGLLVSCLSDFSSYRVYTFIKISLTNEGYNRLSLLFHTFVFLLPFLTSLHIFSLPWCEKLCKKYLFGLMRIWRLYIFWKH